MTNSKSVRMIDRLGVTYDPIMEVYLISVQWKHPSGEPPQWLDRTRFHVLDESDLFEFCADYTKNKVRIDKEAKGE